MLSFVKNSKGGNNLQDSNGYLYCVSKVVTTDPTGILWPALLPPSQWSTATSSSPNKEKTHTVIGLWRERQRRWRARILLLLHYFPWLFPIPSWRLSWRIWRLPCPVLLPIFQTGMLSTRLFTRRGKCWKAALPRPWFSKTLRTSLEISWRHPTWSLIGLKCWTLTYSVATIPVWDVQGEPVRGNSGGPREGTSNPSSSPGGTPGFGPILLGLVAGISSRLQVSSKHCIFVGRVANRQPLYSSRH